MSAEFRAVEFSVVVADYEQWTPEHRAQAEADPNTSLYADWAMVRLREAMQAAGRKFVDEHPDVFEGLT